MHMHKLVKISNLQINSLLYTGSPITLLCKDTYRLLGSFPLSTVPIWLKGFGSSTVVPLSSFPTDIENDCHTFSINAHVTNSSRIPLPISLELISFYRALSHVMKRVYHLLTLPQQTFSYI